jgi:hypothetical protein
VRTVRLALDALFPSEWNLPALLLVGILAVAAAFIVGAAGGNDAAAHQYAEDVLLPECVAKQNNWFFNHPVSDPKHFGAIDVKDRERFELARKSCEKFYAEMKRAAY